MQPRIPRVFVFVEARAHGSHLIHWFIYLTIFPWRNEKHQGSFATLGGAPSTTFADDCLSRVRSRCATVHQKHHPEHLFLHASGAIRKCFLHDPPETSQTCRQDCYCHSWKIVSLLIHHLLVLLPQQLLLRLRLQLRRPRLLLLLLLLLQNYYAYSCYCHELMLLLLVLFLLLQFFLLCTCPRISFISDLQSEFGHSGFGPGTPSPKANNGYHYKISLLKARTKSSTPNPRPRPAKAPDLLCA